MKEATNHNFPIIKIGGWRLLALLVLLIGIAFSYLYASLQYDSIRKNLISQNNMLALSIEQSPHKIQKRGKGASKENKKIRYVFRKNAKELNWYVQNTLVLVPENNKTVIAFSLGDSSALGKPNDLSAPMQEQFTKGGQYFKFAGLSEFQPQLLLYSVNPLEKPPYNYIIFSSKSILTPVAEFISGILLSLLLYVFINHKSKHFRAALINQKQNYFAKIEDALAKVDFNELMELLSDSPGVYENFRKYVLQINKAREEAKAFRQSLETQIKKMVELIAPLTEGKWEMTIDVPPGMLTPIAESINLIAEKANLNIPQEVASTESLEIAKTETPEVSEPEPVKLKTAPLELEKPAGNFGSWKTAISDSSQNIEYLSKQLKLIAKVVPPIFVQIENLYETELNNKLESGSKYNPVSLKSLERLISEKNTIMLTLQNINKITNELLMLHNWVSIKFADAAGEYSSPAN